MKTKRILAAALTFAALPLLADTPEPKKSDDKKNVVKQRTITVNRDGETVVVRGEPVRRAFLGVTLQDLNSELRTHFGASKDAGVLIATVTADSPAAKGGLRVGDIITAIDGTRVDSSGDITRALRGKKEGDRVQVEVIRDRAPRTITATLAAREMRVVRMNELENLPEIIASAGPELKKLEQYFNSPEWRAKVAAFGDCGDTQARIKELEKRLADLEKKTAKQ